MVSWVEAWLANPICPQPLPPLRNTFFRLSHCPSSRAAPSRNPSTPLPCCLPTLAPSACSHPHTPVPPAHPPCHEPPPSTYFPHSAGAPLRARPLSALRPLSADDPLSSAAAAAAAAGAGGMSSYGRGHRGGGVESRGGDAGGEAGSGRGEDGGGVAAGGAAGGVGGKGEGDEVGEGGGWEGPLSAEEWEVWWAEQALFNHSSSSTSSTGGGRDGGGISSAGERLQCAVAASTVLRNLSFLPHCASAMAALPACVAMLVGAMEAFQSEDEEVVSNAVDTFANIAAAIDLSSYPAHTPPLLSSALPPTLSAAAAAPPASLTRSAAAHPGGDTGPQGFAVGAPGSGADAGADAAAGGEGCRGVMSVERVLAALAALLQGPVVAWQAAAAEAWGRLLLCRDNDLLLLPAAAPLQVYRQVALLLASADPHVRATALSCVALAAHASPAAKYSLARQP
ncbi:unnamed protein product, partial [Closterium sp. NIES-53]